MAQTGRTPIVDVPDMLIWARGTLHKIEVSEAAARIRARLDPNPRGEREALMLAELDPARPVSSIDAALDELEAVLKDLEDLQLPPGTRLRLEILDGAGSAIVGRSRVLSSKRTAGGADMSTTNAAAAPPVDVHAEPVRYSSAAFEPSPQLPSQVPAALRNALQVGQSFGPAGDQLVAVPLGLLYGVMLTPAMMAMDWAGQQGRANERLFASQFAVVDTCRKQVVATHESYAGVFERLIEAREEVVEEKGKVKLAKSEAENATPDTPVSQAVKLLESGAKLFESMKGGDGGSPGSVAAEVAADVAAEEGGGLNVAAMLMDPSVPASVIAQLVALHPEAARLREVAEAIAGR